MNKRQALSLDRQEIAAAIADWALWRDTGRWARLRSLYAPGAIMQTTWFDGPADEFIDRSAANFSGKARAQRSIGVSTIDVESIHAIAETRVVLMLRAPLDAVVVDVTCHGRFYDFFIRLNGAWRIQKRIPIYEKDRIDVVDPSVTLKLNSDQLAQFSEGYRHLAYVQAQNGATLPQGLIEPQSEAERHQPAGWAAEQPLRAD